MKLIRPVYKALNTFDPELAKVYFKECVNGYHGIARE
jgi:hypothetical protein